MTFFRPILPPKTENSKLQTTALKTTIKNNVIHIEIPLHRPRPSASGKTLTIAAGADSIVLKVKDISLLHADDFTFV